MNKIQEKKASNQWFNFLRSFYYYLSTFTQATKKNFENKTKTSTILKKVWPKLLIAWLKR